MPWGFSVPLPYLLVGKSIVGPRTFTTVWELLWYNCSPVCGSSTWWLYGGANGDSSKRTYATCCTSHICCSQNPCPHGRPLLTHGSAGDIQMFKGRSGSVSCRVSGSWCTRSFVWALQASLVGMGFESKHDFALPTILLGLLLCPWMWSICFWWDPTFSCQWLFSGFCNFGVLEGEDEYISFYSTILWLVEHCCLSILYIVVCIC